MHQHIEKKIREYLPEINAKELSFDNTDSHPYENNLKQFSENILIWSHTILEKSKLPTLAHEAKPLTHKYSVESDEGCALRIVVELDALKSSVENRDAGTAALASMKLLENVWYSSIFRMEDALGSSIISKNTSTVTTSNASHSATTKDDENIQLYQETINNLKSKYPHCNVNALRLLAATRLNVSKQDLDDLDIRPE